MVYSGEFDWNNCGFAFAMRQYADTTWSDWNVYYNGDFDALYDDLHPEIEDTKVSFTDTKAGEIVRMAITEEMTKSAIEVIASYAKPRDVDIAEADVIVALGRGASGEGIRRQAEELAELLGGMVACTRPLVESTLFDAKHQIGLSGRTVKPKLIICLGISGAVQFAAGMKSSDCIVAVNTDKNAPIFHVAHYCAVGDVGEILPALIAGIKEKA